MTISGNATTIHHNCTSGDGFGLCTNDSGSIHFVSPLTKEMISFQSFHWHCNRIDMVRRTTMEKSCILKYDDSYTYDSLIVTHIRKETTIIDVLQWITVVPMYSFSSVACSRHTTSTTYWYNTCVRFWCDNPVHKQKRLEVWCLLLLLCNIYI